MANIKDMLSTFVTPKFDGEIPSPKLPGDFGDRLDHDLIGLSDNDAMWYYEVRRWRGRD
jgi:hypothetical protein